jgi:VanZ family protein
MALILWLSSDSGSAERTGRLILPVLHFLFPTVPPFQLDAMHGLVRKLGHLAEYAILTALWLRVFVVAWGMAPGRAAWQAWAISAVWAVIDEGYQSTVGSRTGSPGDVALDAVGALIIATAAHLGWRPTVDALARIALWIAAAGGAALVVVNVATDVRSGVLWVTVPVAVLVLVLLRRARP